MLRKNIPVLNNPEGHIVTTFIMREIIGGNP
jgi:hypothetical protein